MNNDLHYVCYCSVMIQDFMADINNMYNNALVITRYIIIFLTRKSKYSLLFIVFLSFCISLLLALIHGTLLYFS